MSNVKIKATGDMDISVAVNLGPNERAVHPCAAGNTVELTVGGNQSLTITAVEEEAAVEETALPTGAGVVEGVEPDGTTPPDPAPAGGPKPISDLSADSPLHKGEELQNPFAGSE